MSKRKAWWASCLMIVVLAGCSGGPAATPLPVSPTQPPALEPTSTPGKAVLSTETTVPNPAGVPSPFHSPLAAILGQGVIASAAVSPDEQVLVIANSDGRVEWFKARTGEALGSLEADPGRPEIVFSPDNKKFALVMAKKASVISLESGKQVASYSTQVTPGIMQVVFAGGSDLLALRESQTYSYGGFGSVVLLSTLDGTPKELPIPNRNEIFQFSPPAASADGALVAAGLTDGRVLVWEVARLRVRVVLGGHNAPVSGVAFSPAGGVLASVATDGSVRVRDLTSGELVNEQKVAPGDVLRVSFEDAQHLLVSGPRRPTLRLDLAGGGPEELTPSFPAPSTVLYERYEAGVLRAGDEDLRLTFSPDGTRLAVVSAVVQVWDVASGKVALVIAPGEGEPARAAAFSPDGSQLLVAYADRAVRSYDAATGARLHELRPASQTGWPVYDVIYSPDGVYLAASDGLAVEIFNAQTGQSLVKIGMSGGEFPVKVAFSDDSRTLFAVLNKATLEMWNVANSRIQRRETIATSNVDGRLERGVGWRWPWLAHFSKGADGSWVEIYNLTSQKTERVAAPAESGTLAFNGSGSLLFARTEGLLCIWRSDTGGLVQCGELTTGYGSALAVSPNADLLALVFGEQVVVWDVSVIK